MGLCAHVSVNLLSRQLTLLWFFLWATVSSDVVLSVCKDKDILWQGINAIVRLE